MEAAAAGQTEPDPRLEQGGLDASAVYRIADDLAERHAVAPVADASAFLAQLESHARTATQRRALAESHSAILRRAHAGRIRRTTGAVEDVLFTLAGMLALLLRDARQTEANILANRYVDVFPQGATGWSLMPLYLSLRLGAVGGDVEQVDAMLAPAPPRMVVIGGLSGTGKSALARLIGGWLGGPQGARVLRADVFRKRLAGVAPETRLPPRHYTRRNDEESYAALFESAEDHLGCGTSVILDGAFISRGEREVAALLASRTRVPFTGIWLEAPEAERAARVARRIHDASDADVHVVHDQGRRTVGDLGGWHRMRSNRPIDTILPAVRAILERGR